MGSGLWWKWFGREFWLSFDWSKRWDRKWERSVVCNPNHIYFVVWFGGVSFMTKSREVE